MKLPPKVGGRGGQNNRILYLAIPLETFDSFFQEPFVQESLKQYQLKLIVYNPEQERIERWIS
ncbi:element excision factor XisH family protein [Limnoraphis robusta]|uniref:Element excision factor XisH family protein n=1 Tax=Limnoraphis robusta CCNP1315 TaxID=3110306 RepID=A0ABU5U3Z1_9CYAN|nr:element excision factor XisH family protein [Limnoraphis robusta]MEA5521896.1 element excision factor XisH family protein [Limnoraphis robusta CCNP1315]MEA5544532.1 element excision factor XisH family protein [Limnoraphis robusta CCNP1324]